ncbi:glyoxal oxidase [Ceratobasidium sp. AG-Ba]|nr:glyoxal oxidase [Ceratobasidium sp. AG-Ba]
MRKIAQPYALAIILLIITVRTVAHPARILSNAHQPLKLGAPNTFHVVGDSGVSAQQLFLGMPNQMFILDKTENNPINVSGHPAWGSVYNVDTNEVRPMDVITNSFCAGGNVLGNGTWLNVGGNMKLGFGIGLYGEFDGGHAVRLITPQENGSAEWVDDPTLYLSTRRWYPTLETLSDGTMIIVRKWVHTVWLSVAYVWSFLQIGGNLWGGYNNPTYEFFPSKGSAIFFEMLYSTLPANLYPLTWLLPSDTLFVQAGRAAAILDYRNNIQSQLSDIPYATRTYPASGGSAMLPLTPANNWTATIIFCGGSNLTTEQWTDESAKVHYPADSSCVRISPDFDATWIDDDPLPDSGRTMGNMIHLPDGKILMLNGAKMGTAGYGNDTWAIDQSYAQLPLLRPLVFDPDAPKGRRWSQAGLPQSTIARMYHSTASLLPDGSVFIAGSNPNEDYNPKARYQTEYRTERFYPWYYSMRRPEPIGLIDQLSYGGPRFDVSLSLDDLFGDPAKIRDTKAVVMRFGFSTHGTNFGMRYLELDSSYSVMPLNKVGTSYRISLHVAQLPPNPALMAPGPAWIFIVVEGIPSIGKMIMVGSGKIGEGSQTVDQRSVLPPRSIIGSTGRNSGGGGRTRGKISSSSMGSSFEVLLVWVIASLVSLGLEI